MGLDAAGGAGGRSARALVFDLDGTLYGRDLPIYEGLTAQALRVFEHFIGTGRAVADEFDRLTRLHGNALLGLHRAYGVPFADLLDLAHRVDHYADLAPAPRLREMLLACPKPAYVFSNGSRTHVERVLRRLELTDAFRGLITAEDCYPHAKPERAAFERLVQITGLPLAAMVLFEDKAKVVRAASALGLPCVFITSGRDVVTGPDVPHYTTVLEAAEAYIPC